MRNQVEIVFRRKVRALWLEQGLAIAAQGAGWSDAKPALAREIAAENSGAETSRKVLEHVRRIWFEPPDSALSLRADALRLYQHDDSSEIRLLLNWGMTMAAYPYVGSAGEVLGRLLKLRKEARRTDIQRRLREQYGDRAYVDRITRYTVSSFLDWGVITETKPKGVYLAGKIAAPKKQNHLAWLAEAVLISRDKTQMSISELSHHPILFPIGMDALHSSSLQSNPRLNVVRQNLNEEYLLLSAQSPGKSFK